MTLIDSFRLETSSWKSLMIEFGGFRLIPEYARGSEINGDKETLKARMKALTEELGILKAKIKSELEKHPEVIQVENLVVPELSHNFYAISEHAIDTAFAPLIVVLHLPSRLQRAGFDSVTRAERFIAILNGSIVIYGADASSSKARIDFTALRDRLAEIVQPVVEPEFVSPNVSKEVFLLNGPQTQTPTSGSDNTLKLTETSTVKEGMKLFYDAVQTMLRFFYEIRKNVEASVTLADNVTEREGRLLSLMRDVSATHFYQVLRRRSNNAHMHITTAELLESLSNYSSLSLHVSQQTHELEKMLADATDAVARKVLERNDWKESSQLAAIDREAVLTVIEQARSEMETSGVVSATLWAALLGAIVGALLTLAASRLL